MKKTTRFKNLVLSGKTYLIPVVHDALCAKIAEDEGFEAIFMGGYANSASLLGKPDVELLTLTEMVNCASRMVEATDLPLFVDGDTGHGNTTNVARTIQLFEKAGVAAIFIEDQVNPKRCGHMSGKQIIPTEEMVAKIKAAVDSRQDDDFMIMARTDAIATDGIDEAIERCHKYVEAGADIYFADAPESTEQLRRLGSEIDAPTMANMIPGGKTPILSVEELEKMGFNLAVYSTACTYVVAKAVQNYFRYLRQHGSTVGMENNMIQFPEFNRLVGLEDIRAKEKKVLSRNKIIRDL